MLHINDILDPDFDWDEIEITEEEFDELSTELVIDYLKKHGPKERQMLALCWNFDNSKEVIRWIVDQPDTDKGTILLLYWYMTPGFYKKFADRKECEEEASWALEDYDIIETIEKNYLSGFYGNQRYITVFEKTECDDLAGYIADDFGLIADSIMLNYSDEWLEKLISCYKKAIIPRGNL